MAEQTNQASTDHRKGASERFARWNKAVEIIWSVWVVAMCIGLFIYVDREIGASPAEHSTDVTLLATGQIVFAVIALITSLFAIIIRDRDRRIARWVWPFAVAFCITITAIGYDGLAQVAPRGTLPMLEQIAPGPVSVAKSLLIPIGILFSLKILFIDLQLFRLPSGSTSTRR